MKSSLIVFEGLDGSGKTTLINAVKDVLNEQGYEKVVITKQPGGCPENADLRKRLCNSEKRLSKEEEEDLFFQDYCIHREYFLESKMKEGYIILCDRHVLYSNLVYQAESEQGMDSVREALLKRGLDKPQIAFILNTPPGICRERTFNPREEEQSAFDKASLDIYKERYTRYMHMLQYPETICVEWSKPLKEQAKEVANIILERI